MILSKAFCFFSAALAIALARSTSNCKSSTSVDKRCLVFSRPMHFWLRDSMVSSASAKRACNFLLASSNSSERATPSDSYLLRQIWASALALLSWRCKSALPSASSSTCSRRLSKSCSKLRNLPKRVARSRDSSSAKRLVSSNWVVREILILDNWETWDSASSNWRKRSEFSMESFFLAASKSLRDLLVSSNLDWTSLRVCCNCLAIFSWAAYLRFTERKLTISYEDQKGVRFLLAFVCTMYN